MVHFKLSPNEEARLLKEERERRRKLRIQQVREQAKVNAAKMRQSVNDEKERLLQELAEQLQRQWLAEKQLKVQQLKKLYNGNISSVGEGHQLAADENIELQRETRSLLRQDDWLQAQQRHLVALQRQSDEAKQRQLEENRHILTRQAVLEVEKIRSAKIASLPPPPHNPLDDIEPLKLCPVKFTDRDAFSTSHYHITQAVVEKATDFEKGTNAKEIAKEEEDRLRMLDLEKHRSNHERAEKARMRHKHAMEEVSLKQEYGKLLGELDHLNRADINRRRQGLEQLPKQIFLAPHRRIEENIEQQYKMERAFEDMYMSATEFTGNLSLALDPHPPPVTPAHSDILDISSQQDCGLPPSEISAVSHQSKNVPPARLIPSSLTRSAPTSDSAPLAHPSSAHSIRDSPCDCIPETSDLSHVRQKSSHSSHVQEGGGTLKKLFDRIKSQRDNWVHKSIPENELADQAPDDASLANHRSCSIGPSLSEGTVSDRTASIIDQSPASLEEGTVSTTASSYRSVQHVSNGFSKPHYPVEDYGSHFVDPAEHLMPPSNLSAALHEEREERRARERQENRLYDDVLIQRQRIDDERRILEERLSAIELKQNQLEEQDRLLSEAFDFPNCTRTDLKSKSVASYQFAPFPSQTIGHHIPVASAVLSQRNHSIEHSDCSNDQHHIFLGRTSESHAPVYAASRQLSSVSSRAVSSATDVLKSEHRNSVPLSTSHSTSELCPPQFERSAFESRVRDYQNQLLQRQPDRQRSLMEARQHLQERAKELLSGVSPSVSVPFNTSQSVAPPRSVSQSPRCLMTPANRKETETNFNKPIELSNFVQHRDACMKSNDVERDQSTYLMSDGDACMKSNYVERDQSTYLMSDFRRYPSVIQKNNHPHLYTSENGERSESSIESMMPAVETGTPFSELIALTDVKECDRLDDEREFVTPELRPDERPQRCRALDDSLAFRFSPVVDPPLVSSASEASNRERSRSSKDDSFNLRVLQAQRELELRQQRMQEQLTALENEERLLIEEHRRIEEQYGNFRATPLGEHKLPMDHVPHDKDGDFQNLVDIHVKDGEQSNDGKTNSIKAVISSPRSTSSVDSFKNGTGSSQHVSTPDHYRLRLIDDSVSSAGTDVSAESKGHPTVDDCTRVTAAGKPLILDLYASSHSDLLNLLAEGYIPSLSGRTSPSTSWNTSYQRILLEELSSRHDSSSFQQLLPDDEGRTGMENETSQNDGELVAKQDEISSSFDYQVVNEQIAVNTSGLGREQIVNVQVVRNMSNLGSEQVMNGQVLRNMSNLGSEQVSNEQVAQNMSDLDLSEKVVQHDQSLCVEPLDHSVSTISTVSGEHHSVSAAETTDERLSSFSGNGNSASRPMNLRHCTERIFINNPVLVDSFNEFVQLGDAEQELCQTPQPAFAILSSVVCDRGDADHSAAASSPKENRHSKVSCQLPSSPDALRHPESRASAVEKQTSFTCPSDQLPAQNKGFTCPSDQLPAQNKGFTCPSDQLPAQNKGFTCASDQLPAQNKGFTCASDQLLAQNKVSRFTSNTRGEHVLEFVADSGGDQRQSSQQDLHSLENWEAILKKYQDKPVLAKQNAAVSGNRFTNTSKPGDPCEQTTSYVTGPDANVSGTSKSLSVYNQTSVVQSNYSHTNTTSYVTGRDANASGTSKSLSAYNQTGVAQSNYSHTNASKLQDKDEQAFQSRPGSLARPIRNAASECDLPANETWKFSLTEGSGGITDEPDITLASGATSRDISSLSQDDFPTPESSTESSLHLFERYERLLLDPSFDSFPLSSSVTPQNVFAAAARSSRLLQTFSSEVADENSAHEIEREITLSKLEFMEKPLWFRKLGHQSKSSGVRFTLPDEDIETDELDEDIETDELLSESLDCITSAPLSLREALTAKRPSFAQSVEKRLAEAKEKARTNTRIAQQNSKHGRTVAMWKKSRSLAGPNSEREPNDDTPAFEFPRDDQNLAVKDTKERTKRLYNQLEEVKKRKAEQQRQKEYQQNRERRKEYEKQLRKTRKSSNANT